MAEEIRKHWTRGGRRPGAGRPITPGRLIASERHKPRPDLKKGEAAHITMRVVEELVGLRNAECYQAVHRALTSVYDRPGIRIIGASVQRTHIHLLAEADDAEGLSHGMQAFQISLAKHLNRAYSTRAKLAKRRRGQVFIDRYREEVVSTAVQARAAWLDLVNNWRKHDEHDGARGNAIDPYSSASSFDGWSEPVKLPEGVDPLPVHAPRTALMKTAWREHGLIGPREVPGRKPR
ncbi:MAG TPA: transposase [Kofleriaceae bacterium]|nr:transposase [Kofleriaceae bacterium]